MNPTTFGVTGPGFLNQVPTLGFQVQGFRFTVHSLRFRASRWRFGLQMLALRDGHSATAAQSASHSFWSPMTVIGIISNRNCSNYSSRIYNPGY